MTLLEDQALSSGWTLATHSPFGFRSGTFSRYAGRMLGTSLPFAEHSTFEDDSTDVRYQITDPILAVSVSGLFIKLCTATREFLEQAPIDWCGKTLIKS